jgi:hypothetical protein
MSCERAGLASGVAGLDPGAGSVVDDPWRRGWAGCCDFCAGGAAYKA